MARRPRAADSGDTLFGFRVPDNAWLPILLVVAVVCPALVAWAWIEGDRDRVIVRTIVFGGWFVSLLLHELAHSFVAYLGGDRGIRERGYLTLNPFRYMDPVLSLALPMFLVAIGGMPLIGGRTMIDSAALRSQGWEIATSLAGPAANVLCAVLIGLGFQLGMLDPLSPIGFGFAFLALLQVGAAVFNLIPIPPFDGYHALEPMLPPDVVRFARSLGFAGIFLVFIAFWQVPGLSEYIWDPAWEFIARLGIPDWSAWIGGELARFELRSS